jgi:sec-independent protein translocase protein TatA
MAPSWWQILIVLVLFVLLFGRGKISDLMGDVAKGIKSFKSGMADDGEEKAEPDPKAIEHERAAPQTRAKSAPRAKSTSRAKAPRKQKSS